MKKPRFLEYIETDGTQYIDTGIQISGESAIEMSARITTPSSNYDTYFGTRDGNSRRFGMRYGNSPSDVLQAHYSTYDNYTTGYETWNTGLKKNQGDGKWIGLGLDGYRFIYGKGRKGYAHASWWEGTSFHVPGHEFKYSGTCNVYPASLYLCAMHDAAAGAVDFAKMQLSSCQIYTYVREHFDLDQQLLGVFRVLVRAFFPALDDNGHACLYDAVSDEYFYSPNGAAFIAGPQRDQMLFRVHSHDVGYENEYHLRAVESITLPRDGYYASSVDCDMDTDIFEFAGYDTAQEAFTAVYPAREYRDTGVPLGTDKDGQVLDVYAVWKYLYGYLVRDGTGNFYTKNRDGSRRNLGPKTLEAQTFRDYAFQDFPLGDMLTDLNSPSIYNWTKKYWEDDERVKHYYAPATFDVTLRGVPPLPQLVTYPTVTLRKPVDCVTIPGDDFTLWNVSFDGGATWYKYERGWIRCTEEGDGCLKRRLELLDNSDWTPVITAGTLRFRAWMRKDAWVSAIRIDYLEGD